MKFSEIRKLVSVIFILGMLAACTPAVPIQDPALTLTKYEDVLTKYNQITADMTYAEVVRIMGISGEEPPADILTALPTEVDPAHFQYFYPDGFIIHVTLSGGTVFIKGFGWSPDTIMPRTNAQTTVAKYEQIKVGMTYEEVVAILGSPGVLRSSRIQYRSGGQGSKIEIFAWWPEDEPEDSPLQIMMVSFWDGVVADKQ
jgi:hypothetical protein